MAIHLIIQQLLNDSQPEDIWDESVGKIESLTPIIKVGGGESTASEPENSFYVGTAADVMPTLIVSEELYPSYLDLDPEEFVARLNKAIFNYIQVKVIEAKQYDSWNDECVWYKPNQAFVNWFHEKRIEIDSMKPFSSLYDTRVGIPDFLSKWGKEVVRLLLKNDEMKHQDILLALDGLPQSYNHISKIFKTPDAKEFFNSEIVNDNSYYSLREPSRFK